MKKENALVVFVKAPIPGSVKTRLSPSLSAKDAAALYVSFARDLVASLRELKHTDLHIAYEPHPVAPDPSWCSRDLPFFFQRGVDLGERMLNAYSRMFRAGARRIVILGSDCPGLPVSYVQQAFADLKEVDVTLGPSTDGGYYLVGMSRLCQGIFKDVPWSTSEVMSCTIANAEKHGYSFRLLPSYFDIDTVQDVLRVWRDRDRGAFQRSAPLTCLTLARLFDRFHRRVSVSADRA